MVTTSDPLKLPCAAAAAPPRLTALRARTRQAKAGQDASGDSLLDGLLDELKADPMGVSAAPAKKRSFAGANAHRSAMPSYRPNQGGSTYGAPPPSNDDYTRAPPRLSVNDLCEEAGGAEAPTFGAESDAQFAEDEPQPVDDATTVLRPRSAPAAVSASVPAPHVARLAPSNDSSPFESEEEGWLLV